MATTRFGSNIETPQVKNTGANTKYGEKEIDIQFSAQLGTGAAPLATAELNGAGLQGFFMFSSGDEFDFMFRVPADFDATATSYVQYYYALATGAGSTSVDTCFFAGTYNIPSLNAATTKVADATTTTGVTNPTGRVQGQIAKGVVYTDQITLASTSTLATGKLVHFQLTASTTNANDTELRLWNKVVFKYARAYV